jgi:MuDR family transposase
MAPPFSTGDIFASLSDFKTAVKNWSIANSFAYRVQDSDRKRVIIKCRVSSECPFSVRANYNAERDCAIVGKMEPSHTCDGLPQTRRGPPILGHAGPSAFLNIFGEVEGVGNGSMSTPLRNAVGNGGPVGNSAAGNGVPNNGNPTPIGRVGDGSGTGETASERKHRTRLTAAEDTILLKLCVDNGDEYKSGNKTQFWKKISDLLEEATGELLFPLFPRWVPKA